MLNNTIERKVIEYAQEQISFYFRLFDKSLSVNDIRVLTDDLLSQIDWDNPALMHKGYSWMVKTYLNKRNRVLALV
jgi:hypothetical protein